VTLHTDEVAEMQRIAAFAGMSHISELIETARAELLADPGIPMLVRWGRANMLHLPVSDDAILHIGVAPDAATAEVVRHLRGLATYLEEIASNPYGEAT